MQPILSRKRSRTDFFECESPVSKKIATINSSLPLRMAKPAEESVISPQELLMQILKEQKIEVQIKDALEIQDFFSEYTEEEVAAYDSTSLNAIRSQNVAKLREFHESGRPLKCSNTFGESLLHLACRRNFLDVAKFLIHEAKVPVRIRDDYGRTILHDAAWTCEPNFELIEVILRECPDLLFLRDRRGHLPIAYARKSHWSAWNKFLKERKELVVPTEPCLQSAQ